MLVMYIEIELSGEYFCKVDFIMFMAAELLVKLMYTVSMNYTANQ